MNYIDMKLSECCMSITDGDHLPPPKASSGIPGTSKNHQKKSIRPFKNSKKYGIIKEKNEVRI